MVKRSIQIAKPGFTVGIEYNHLAIRGARLSSDGRGFFEIDRLQELKGDFSEDIAILEGFRQIKSQLSINSRDPVVTCLSGKQVFAAQIPFRKLAHEEMEQALRLELRKTVHFEVATSTLDFEIVSEERDSNGGVVQVLAALAANSLLNRQLHLLEKAGLKADSVDVLPVAIANALWAWKGEDPGHNPLVALHIGPQTSTIVIDGENTPFFNRNIYFAAEDVFAPKASEADREKRIQSLLDEVARSLAFYEKNSGSSGFQEIIMLGGYLEEESLYANLRRLTGLTLPKMHLAEKMGFRGESASGCFDLAISLAMRGEI